MNESNKRVEYSSKERKICKLKRLNVVLGQRRKSIENRLEFEKVLWLKTCAECLVYGREFKGIRESSDKIFKKDIERLKILSEQIGRNSAKIQRLRILIQQEKKVNEHIS